MRVWDQEHGTIHQVAKAMADEPGALSFEWHYQRILAAIWRGELPMLEWAREDLWKGAAVHLWRGETLLVVDNDEDGMRLCDWLRKKYPQASLEMLERLVNGYAPTKIAADMGIVWSEKDSNQEKAELDKTEVENLDRHIFLNSEPTALEAELANGDCIRVPAVPPFVEVPSFDDLAILPLAGYSSEFREVLNSIGIEIAVVKAWHDGGPRNATSDQLHRAGAKPKYDWPTFKKEAKRVLDQEGLPDSNDPAFRSKNSLVKRMEDWCETKWSEVPADSTLKKYTNRAIDEFTKERSGSR